MKKKSILFLCLIGMALFMSCSDKSSAEFEVSLEGQLVKTDVNKGKWPKWMLGDNIYAIDHDRSIYSSKLTSTEWQKAEKVFVHGHGQNEFGDVVISKDNNGALYVIDHPFEGDMGSLAMTSLTKIKQTGNIGAIKDPNNWEKYDLSKMPFWLCGDRFVVLSDSTILTVGTPKDDIHHIFSVINFKNQTFIPLDYWPNDSLPEVVDEGKLMVYAHDCGIIGNDKGRFLYWAEHGGKLAFIFTIDGSKTNILSHLYADRLPIPGIDKTPLPERVHCCADNNRIYLLYRNSNSKGEILETFDRKDPFPWGNTVEVYDWDGVKQHIIHLDKFGQEIMLSQDGKTLYLYSGFIDDETDFYIYSYDISSL